MRERVHTSASAKKRKKKGGREGASCVCLHGERQQECVCGGGWCSVMMSGQNDKASVSLSLLVTDKEITERLRVSVSDKGNLVIGRRRRATSDESERRERELSRTHINSLTLVSSYTLFAFDSALPSLTRHHHHQRLHPVSSPCDDVISGSPNRPAAAVSVYVSPGERGRETRRETRKSGYNGYAGDSV